MLVVEVVMVVCVVVDCGSGSGGDSVCDRGGDGGDVFAVEVW